MHYANDAMTKLPKESSVSKFQMRNNVEYIEDPDD